MPKNKLPWRTLVPPSSYGRLNPEEVKKAILEVKALREAREARARKRVAKAHGREERQA